MLSLLWSAIVFAIGLLALGALVPGMQVKGFWGALKGSVICGVLSAVLGKILLVVLTLVLFIPIVLTGPLGVFVVQGLVNYILLGLTAGLTTGLSFSSRRTRGWAALALTLAQVLVSAFT